MLLSGFSPKSSKNAERPIDLVSDMVLLSSSSFLCFFYVFFMYKLSKLYKLLVPHVSYKKSNIGYFRETFKKDNRCPLSMGDLDTFELAILKVMHSRKIYGSNHKRFETVMKSGFPTHEYKNSKNAIESLIKKGYVLWYHRADESIQLNKERYQEIDRIIRESIEKD